VLNVARTLHVDRRSGRGVGLGAIDVGVRGGMQDDVGGEAVDGRVDGLRVADVERVLAAQEDLALEDAGERRGQLASGTGDEPARHGASPAAPSAA
jgi:hypothetical protein